MTESRFWCKLCDMTYSTKSNYEKHLTTKKHQKKMGIIHKIYKCKHCHRKFKHHSSYYRHLNDRCSANSEISDLHIQEVENGMIPPENIHESEVIRTINQLHQEKNELYEKIIKIQKEAHEQSINNLKNSQKDLKDIALRKIHTTADCNHTTNNTTNVQLNNSTINNVQYLNQNMADMIDIETFINNYQDKYQLSEQQSLTLLESYQLNGLKSYAKCLSKTLKKICHQQMKDRNIDYPISISFPIITTDSNLRSVKVKTQGGWETNMSDEDLIKIIVISNDLVYQHHQTGIYLPPSCKDKVITYIKKDNPIVNVKKTLDDK